MKVWLLQVTTSELIDYGDWFTDIIKGYYLKEEAEEALLFRKQLLADSYTFSDRRCVEYELSKLGDIEFYRKDEYDSFINSYDIIETEIL